MFLCCRSCDANDGIGATAGGATKKSICGRDFRSSLTLNAIRPVGREQLGVLRFVPVDRELVGRSDEQGIALDCEGLGGLEPGAKRLFREFLPSAFEEPGPDFARGERH